LRADALLGLSLHARSRVLMGSGVDAFAGVL